MQDNDDKFKIELTNEEYQLLDEILKEQFEILNKMTEDERLQYFRDKYCFENKLNFEKEINGTIYKVNTYFNETANESILEKFFRLTKKS